MIIVNLTFPFLDNHLLIKGEVGHSSYEIVPLDNTLFTELVNIPLIINNSLNNIDGFNIYNITDLLPVNYSINTTIQDLPGILLSTTFDGINVADRLYEATTLSNIISISGSIKSTSLIRQSPDVFSFPIEFPFIINKSLVSKIIHVTGSINANSEISGELIPIKPISGSIIANSQINSSCKVVKNLFGSIIVNSSITGNIEKRCDLEASTIAISNISSTISNDINLTTPGIVCNSFIENDNVNVIINISGSIIAESSITGTITKIKCMLLGNAKFNTDINIDGIMIIDILNNIKFDNNIYLDGTF